MTANREFGFEVEEQLAEMRWKCKRRRKGVCVRQTSWDWRMRGEGRWRRTRWYCPVEEECHRLLDVEDRGS